MSYNYFNIYIFIAVENYQQTYLSCLISCVVFKHNFIWY